MGVNSIYRWGNETTGDTVYNYGGETVYKSADEVVKAPIPLSEIPNGDVAQIGFYVPDDVTFTLRAIGVEDENRNVPDGLSIQVYDPDGDDVIYTSTSRHEHSPFELKTVSGPLSLRIRIVNDTGDTINATGYARYYFDGE